MALWTCSAERPAEPHIPDRLGRDPDRRTSGLLPDNPGQDVGYIHGCCPGQEQEGESWHRLEDARLRARLRPGSGEGVQRRVPVQGEPGGDCREAGAFRGPEDGR